MTDQELKEIKGGTTNITASLLNQVVRGATLLLELGRSLGSAIRRLRSGKLCS